ncbi:hypothetical protein GH714_034490 [Hevea brasiliensis]|uniref:Uncharacterized protein n=1 Tax=Hevea brasiliensis TaxID=3981 RepID=A0A6A6M6L2_HEVBR|nr:hypothetical protein GH714_034490 [Hevea brasiliensis]
MDFEVFEGTYVGLTFDRVKMSDSVIGYVDSDFAGDLNRRRSLTGYCLLFLELLSVGRQHCKLQLLCLPQRLNMALAKAVKEALWLQETTMAFIAVETFECMGSTPRLLIAEAKLLASPKAIIWF